MADLFIKYRCSYCQDEILSVRIQCDVCDDYILCIQCFSLGCEIGPHKPNHAYKIIDPGTFSIFNSQCEDKNSPYTWTAREDYQLLDAIEINSYGNWEDVAKHIETRDSEYSKDHYCERFVMGAIGKATWLALPNGLLASGESRLKAIDHTCPDNAPLSPSITSRLPPLAILPEETLELGYMPQRDDFEREHDNEAEAIVSHLAINHDDDDIDLALKLAHVDMYTRRLRERARRKRVARDFQLVSQFFTAMKKEKEKPTTAAKKRESQKEKEIQEKLRAFSQFHTASEHELMLKNLSKERALRLRVRELIKYRRNGLTRQEECTEYERQRYFRERRRDAKLERQRRKSGSSGPGTIVLNPGTLGQKSDSGTKEEAQTSNCQGGKFTSCSVLNVLNSQVRHVPYPSASTLLSKGDWTQSNWQEAVKTFLFDCDDLTLYPGNDLLSLSERQLCQSLRLRPLHYLSMKTNLLLNGKGKAIALPGLAAEEQNIIINYFRKSGFSSIE